MSIRRLSQLLGAVIVAGVVLAQPVLAAPERQWGPHGPYGPYRYPRGYVIDDFSASVKFSVDQKDAGRRAYQVGRTPEKGVLVRIRWEGDAGRRWRPRRAAIGGHECA